MTKRLGSWQMNVLSWLQQNGTVTFASVRPRGRAGAYLSRYQRSFLSLAGIRMPDGRRVEAGPVGPRGGIGLRLV